jgi:hypothetical protein
VEPATAPLDRQFRRLRSRVAELRLSKIKAPALYTLFLAVSIAFRGRLVRYAGRILRTHPGKTTAEVHDYHHTATSVLASSLAKRAPGYIRTSSAPGG